MLPDARGVARGTQPSQIMDVDNIENPTLYEVKELTRDYGLVGEQDTVMVVFLSFFGGGFVVMSGLSSGGKDEVVDAAEYCVPDEWVFQVPTSLSKTDLYTKALNADGAENPNNCPVHRHKDITNISGKDFLEDIWKANGDGRSISHSWTEVMGQERETRSSTIHPPNCLILFLATDNEQVDLNDYPEVRNRALVVGIDDSQDLTERVNERQSKKQAGVIEYNLSEQRTKEIREYVDSIPMHMYASEEGSGGYLNPVSPALDNQNPLPQHFTEARRDFPRLNDFMESVTLFHYDDRMEVPRKFWDDNMRVGNAVTLLVTPADAWLGMRIFGEKMVLSALNLRDKDFALLEVLRQNYGKQFDVGTLQQMMRQQGWNLTDNDVRKALKNMKTKGYVRVDKSGTPHEWSASEFAQQVSREVQLDWPSVIEDTRELVFEHYPDDVAEQYEEQFLEGDGLLVTHPFDGHTINLAEEEANELEETVEEQQEKEEETFEDNSLFDSEDSGDGSSSSQGTLT